MSLPPDPVDHATRVAAPQSLHVAVTGASGLIGSAVVPMLSASSHQVTRLVRREAGVNEVRWDPAIGRLDAARLEGVDAVVHLAGENLAAGRWSANRKRQIRESRVQSTRLLSEALAGLRRPPRVLVSASAVGIYGDRGEELLADGSVPGAGFLADVTQAWEQAAEPAAAAGIRVVYLRFGVVLSRTGGALAKMLPAFRLGIAGRLGDGRQWLSWLSIDDATGIVHHVLLDPSMRGPVNAVAPFPVRNADFTNTLARVLRRPALVPVPRLALRLALGEMADAALLASTRAVPTRLLDAGYRFRHASLEHALPYLLGVDLPE